MLFEPDRHEALCDIAWDASRTREAIRSIVRDIEQSQLAEGHWPTHPLDDDGDKPRAGYKSVYLGSAGVLWALWYLQREGAVELGSDPKEGMQRADAAYQADPDTGEVVPSYYLGEVGILLLLWRLTGSAIAADRLHASVRSNIPNPTNEALWAAPGTMVAAWHLWEATERNAGATCSWKTSTSSGEPGISTRRRSATSGPRTCTARSCSTSVPVTALQATSIRC